MLKYGISRPLPVQLDYFTLTDISVWLCCCCCMLQMAMVKMMILITATLMKTSVNTVARSRANVSK